MVKRINISLIATLIFFLIAGCSYAQPAVYDLGNGYTAVRNDVFDKLVENDKLLDLAKEEAEYYKKTLDQYIKLTEQKDEIQNNRIIVLKETLELKDNIISYKDDNIQNWRSMYNIKEAEVRSLKTKNVWEKILTVGLGAYAFSQLDDSTDKAVVGGLTIYLVTN